MAKAKKIKHVAVAGNIGAGKTTLTELLSKHYRWIPQFEDVDQNPYLMDFYDDMPLLPSRRGQWAGTQF